MLVYSWLSITITTTLPETACAASGTTVASGAAAKRRSATIVIGLIGPASERRRNLRTARSIATEGTWSIGVGRIPYGDPSSGHSIRATRPANVRSIAQTARDPPT